ncbi:MAG: hypothetical protein QP766_00095 [Peptoniphilus lacrimalis]|nr:hypothetical protein HMPREF2134_06425 [Peptoniphilus lacrimalis DNF00528]MDK8281181.1 hypothetical protein [Peptoniphilus lacrimalis]
MLENYSAYIHPIELSYILIEFLDIVLINITLSTEKHIYEFIDKKTYRAKYITYMLILIPSAFYTYIKVYTNFDKVFLLPYLLLVFLIFLWCRKTKKNFKKYREDYKDK